MIGAKINIKIYKFCSVFTFPHSQSHIVVVVVAAAAVVVAVVEVVEVVLLFHSISEQILSLHLPHERPNSELKENHKSKTQVEKETSERSPPSAVTIDLNRLKLNTHFPVHCLIHSFILIGMQ